MAKQSSYSKGDFVFAKVKGFPPWPARITATLPSGKYAVFFYGTFETANVKKAEIWQFTKENEAKFVEKNLHRKGYSEGMDQIYNTPEIGLSLSDTETEESGMSRVLDSPGAVNSKRSATTTTSTSSTTTPGTPGTPVLLRRPVKLSDGTPVKREASAAAAAAGESPGPGGKRDAAVAGSGGGAVMGSANKRRVLKRGTAGEEELNTSKSNVDDLKESSLPTNSGGESGTLAGEESQGGHHNLDALAEDPRKIWVKMKGSGDLIEINLDRDKPTTWESNEKRLQWELGTARNAVKLKRGVEGGRILPGVIGEKIREKAELTPAEKDLLRKEAVIAKRKKKIGWLKREQEMIDLEMAIKSALKAESPNTEECIIQQHKFLQLHIERLMLLKQPDTLTTVRRLRKYVGPEDVSGYSEKEKEKLNKNIKTIQIKGDLMYNKLKAVFQFRESQEHKFPDYLNTQVEKFKQNTQGMDEFKILSLTEYPAQSPTVATS